MTEWSTKIYKGFTSCVCARRSEKGSGLRALHCCEPLLPRDIAEAVCYMLSTRPHVQVQDILLSPLGQGI